MRESNVMTYLILFLMVTWPSYHVGWIAAVVVTA